MAQLILNENEAKLSKFWHNNLIWTEIVQRPKSNLFAKLNKKLHLFVSAKSAITKIEKEEFDSVSDNTKHILAMIAEKDCQPWTDIT